MLCARVPTNMIRLPGGGCLTFQSTCIVNNLRRQLPPNSMNEYIYDLKIRVLSFQVWSKGLGPELVERSVKARRRRVFGGPEVQ